MLRANPDRALYPRMLIVKASWYLLFTLIGAKHNIARALLITVRLTGAAVVRLRRILPRVVMRFVAHDVLKTIRAREVL